VLKRSQFYLTPARLSRKSHLPLVRKHSPDGPPDRGSRHLIAAILRIYRPRKDERLSWPAWWTSSGRFTHKSGHHQLQVKRRTGKVRQTGVSRSVPRSIPTKKNYI